MGGVPSWLRVPEWLPAQGLYGLYRARATAAGLRYPADLRWRGLGGMPERVAALWNYELRVMDSTPG